MPTISDAVAAAWKADLALAMREDNRRARIAWLAKKAMAVAGIIRLALGVAIALAVVRMVLANHVTISVSCR